MIGDAGERAELSTLAGAERPPLAAEHELVTRIGEHRPGDVVGARMARRDRFRDLAALDEGDEPRRLGR